MFYKTPAFPGRDLPSALSILGNGWSQKIALAGETGLQAFLCSGMTQFGLQFKGKTIIPGRTLGIPGARRDENFRMLNRQI